MNFKSLANDGIDTVTGFLIDNLPIASPLRGLIKSGVDQTTDMIFDEKTGTEVPFAEHSDLLELKAKIEPFALDLIGESAVLIKKHILSKVDIPYVEGKNEELFEDGLILQYKALAGQLVDDRLVRG